MNDLLDALARLDARLENLERRLLALEHLSKPATPLTVQAATPVSEAGATEQFAPPQAGGVFAVVGKAMLGIAGAYVLRAVAESGSFPKLAVVALALAYAGTWLVWATRIPEGARFASTAYAATAGLILAPMMGELTLRFRVLPASLTAALLSAFVLAASALAWKRHLTPVIWVADVTGVSAALILLIASHDLVPYIAALLVVAVASEFAAARNRWLPLRFLVAPAVDVAVWILIYIHSLPESSRSAYTAVNMAALLALPSALFLIYGASVAYRTTWLCQRITIFEIAQAVISFLLAAISCLWFMPGAGPVGLGVFCWLLSALCYAAAFIRFDRNGERRNYHVYATWSAALVLTGSFLVLSPQLVAPFLSLASIVVTLVGARVARLTLYFHGLAYLAGAALTSGLLEFTGSALVGTVPTVPGWMVWIAVVSALACYAISGRFPDERRSYRLLRLLSAILAFSAAAAFLVSGLVWLAALGMTLGPSQVAVIRTLVTCVFALALAFNGARWQRIELVWTAYGVLAFVSAKLLFEDLPHGHSGSIAISIFLYAVALIIVPRVARPGRAQK
jgi:hypothetical protein